MGANVLSDFSATQIIPSSVVPSITKSASGSVFTAGSTITYTLTVCAGSVGTSGIVTDVLAPEFNPATVVSTDFTVSGSTLTSGSLSLVVGCHTLTYSVQVPASCCTITLPNCATITYDISGNILTATACTNIQVSSNATPITGNISTTGLIIPITGASLHVSGTLTIDVNTVIQASSICFDQGASIIVPAGRTLDIQTSTLFACNEMWRGITAEASPTIGGGGILYLKGSTVRDAQYAVKAKENSEIQIIDNHFEDNFVGILFTTPSPFSPLIITHTIRKNSFIGTGTLHPAYAGQSPALSNRPFAGVLAQNVGNIVRVGNNTAGNENTFNGMNAGIITNDVNLVARRNFFRNIHAIAAYATYPFNFGNGCGIAACGATGNFTLLQSGFGQAIADPVGFDDCDAGVFGLQINSEIQSNNMTNILQYGVIQRFSQNRTISVFLNRIQSRFIGIRLGQNDPATNIVVELNNITIPPLMSTTPESAGIDIREGNATNPSMIRDNTVTVYSGQWGIRASNSTGTEIRSNDIFLNDFANNLAGIRLESCNNMRVMCNNITGSITTQLSRQTAIWGEMSTNTLYSCNNTSQCYTGVRFTGFCNGTDLRGTIIGTHRIGFELSFGAFMGIQTHSGNQWTGTYNIIGATADPLDTPTSYFIVNSLTPPLVPTTYAALNLFVPTPGGITFSCTVGGPFSICSEVLGAAQQLNSGDYLIAQDELQPTLFPDPNKWMADSYLYEKLDNNTSLITAGPIWAFYDSVYNTTMHDIYGISKDADAVFDLSAGTKATLAANAVLKTNYTQQYEAIDDQLADTNISSTDKADLEAQKNTLSQSLNNLNAANQNLINGIAIAQHLAAQTVKTQNGLLSVGELCAQNQKVVNDIYLYTLAQGTPDLNPDQANQLLAIAQQCPLAGGRAVHQARGLYSNINPTQTYTDASTCAEQGIAYKTQVAANANSTTQPMFGIYPNPANNKATLVLHNPAVGNYTLLLQDATGTTLTTYTLNTGDMAVNMPLSTLPNGLYVCHLYHKQVYLGTQKLVIAH